MSKKEKGKKKEKEAEEMKKKDDQEIYDSLYERYKDGRVEDILYLYALHRQSSMREGDFHSIAEGVCRDILRRRNKNG